MTAWGFLWLHLKMFGLVAIGCGLLELAGRGIVRAFKAAAQRSRHQSQELEVRRREPKPQGALFSSAACLYHHQPVRNLH